MPFIAGMLASPFSIFIGAFLLFQVQPLIGKYLLPWFGGGPSVWTTCLFFFQAFLVAGYAYAHLLTKHCKPRTQGIIHAGLMTAALGTLPIVPSEAWQPATPEHPAIALLILLTVKLGLPYLVLASTSPLIQNWSSIGGSAKYRLYSLSNLGSLLALLSYPIFFETHLTRASQAKVWGWGFMAYAASLGICAFCSLSVNRWNCNGESNEAIGGTKAVPPLSGQRALWLLWPACATALLLSITNKLCLDVAVFPLLWVVPLGLYLLSFVVCFAGPKAYWRNASTFVLLAVLVLLCWALFRGAGWPLGKQICVYAGALFVCCLVCHGELFRIRPESDRLTEFYLIAAVGGALGGLFVSLVAPAIFTNYYELHWSTALLGLLVLIVRTREGLPLLLPNRSSTPSNPAGRKPTTIETWTRELAPIGLVAIWLFFFALVTALWLQARRAGDGIVHKSRNFYGVLTVFEHRKDEPNGHHFLLQHGRITHGFQFVDPQLQNWPTTYYGPDSGLGLMFAAMDSGARRVGVVGLGTGTIAAYGREGDQFSFYEINPQVSCLATSRFTFITHCRAQCEITLGDARLELHRQSPRDFDLLVLDAFNSDSIPVHLLTCEAFQVYLRHLKPRGVMAIHISNHFLDLEPVVAGLARRFNLRAVVIDQDPKPEQWWIYASTWMLLARDQAALNSPSIVSAARRGPEQKETLPLWTDDFSSLFRILK